MRPVSAAQGMPPPPGLALWVIIGNGSEERAVRYDRLDERNRPHGSRESAAATGCLWLLGPSLLIVLGVGAVMLVLCVVAAYMMTRGGPRYAPQPATRSRVVRPALLQIAAGEDARTPIPFCIHPR
jgi:Na+-transporting methylmalonyl-CoA/oxaloacetate decarboxylase gamma subunit